MTKPGDRPPGSRWRALAACGSGGAREVISSAPCRNALFALFIGGILAYGATFAWYMLDRFDLVNLLRDVNQDDAFYYFRIARHMAEGEFSTFDGLTRTNGYHPIWLFLITPFYWTFDKVEALFAIKAFEVMLVAGGVALVAGAARVARLPWILLFAALPTLYRNTALFKGMEAAAALFLLAVFLLAICLFVRDPTRWRQPLAAVAFALPWVRLEYVAISLAATAALCLVEWSGRQPSALAGGLREALPPARRERTRRSVLALDAAAPLFGALAGVLAYFAYNGIVFGGIVPVSAATKRFRSQAWWESEGGYSLTENVHAFLQSGFFDHELLVALEVCVYVVLVWWFSRRSRGREDRLLLAFLVGVFGLAAGHLAKFVQSVLTVHPRWGAFDWYFVPAYLMEALVVPARCYVAIWFVRRFIGPARIAPGLLSSGVAVTGVIFLSAKADFTDPFQFVDRHAEAAQRGSWKVPLYMGTMVSNRVLPEDSVLSIGGGGLVGYFSRFPVMNRDGLANSWDYLRARKESGAAVRRFFQRHGVTHQVVRRRLSDTQEEAMLFAGPPFNARMGAFLFALRPMSWHKASWSGADRSAWFLERMEPHLERRTDGVGLLMDGRVAQAFARDCAPDELAVWTVADRGDEAAAGSWRPWTKTWIGLCTSTFVLPHDALPPVRAATMTVGEYLVDRVGGRRPEIRSDFDVYLVENRLVYVKDPCGRDDVAARFFLHVDPAVPDDLPGHREQHGFDNLDFGFGDHRFDEFVFGDGHSARVGGTCLADIPLPEYGIAAIRTGQYVATEDGFHRIWSGEIRRE